MKNLLLKALFWEYYTKPMFCGISSLIYFHKRLKEEAPHIYTRAMGSLVIEFILIIIIITLVSCL